MKVNEVLENKALMYFTNKYGHPILFIHHSTEDQISQFLIDYFNDYEDIRLINFEIFLSIINFSFISINKDDYNTSILQLEEQIKDLTIDELNNEMSILETFIDFNDEVKLLDISYWFQSQQEVISKIENFIKDNPKKWDIDYLKKLENIVNRLKKD